MGEEDEDEEDEEERGEEGEEVGDEVCNGIGKGRGWSLAYWKARADAKDVKEVEERDGEEDGKKKREGMGVDDDEREGEEKVEMEAWEEDDGIDGELEGVRGGAHISAFKVTMTVVPEKDVNQCN